MDTYGDMVTLLLTFFIMLFAMSNLNEQKWEVFVRSIYPRSTQEVQEQVSINSPVGNAESEMEGTLDVPDEENFIFCWRVHALSLDSPHYNETKTNS